MKIVFIPRNGYGVEEGEYTMNEIVQLLRECKNYPEVIEFLADMLEE